MSDNYLGTYAGIWSRLAAHVIDWTIVSVALFPVILVIHTSFPSLLEVKVPFDVFVARERVETGVDGNEVIERESFLGLFENVYRTTTFVNEKGRQEERRELIDPQPTQALSLLAASLILKLELKGFLLSGARLVLDSLSRQSHFLVAYIERVRRPISPQISARSSPIS